MPSQCHVVTTAVVLSFCMGAALAMPQASDLESMQSPAREVPELPWQPGPEKFQVHPAGAPHPSLALYPSDGDVRVDVGKTLMNALSDPYKGGKNWYFIEIYDHMCPHCWYAVPIVTRVAAAFRGTEGLTLTTMNCHAPLNAKACFYLELVSGAIDFPTFLLCPPGSNVTAPEAAMYTKAQSFFGRLNNVHREKFLKLSRCKIRFIEKNTPRGQENPFLSAEDIAQWITDETSFEPRFVEELSKGADFTDNIAPDPRSPPGRPGWLKDDREGSPGMPRWVPGVRWKDALAGFVHLARSNYRPEKHQAAVDATSFLARTFPVKGGELRKLAADIKEFGPQDDPSMFSGLFTTWANQVGLPDPGEDNVDPKYVTCDGSTCVIWTILHVAVTAAAARGVSGRPLLQDGSVHRKDSVHEFPDTSDCMHFVRQFVDAFLNCNACRSHFLEDFDSCEYGRCEIKPGDWRALVLWLWRAHNAVSLRVAVRQRAPVDRRWPMYEDCPACWQTDLVEDGVRIPADHRRKLLVSPAKQVGQNESSPPRRLGQLWTRADLDAPFHVDQVFWQIIRTYVGLPRIRLETEDLTPQEFTQVDAVLEKDRRREALAHKRWKKVHKGFVNYPPAPYIQHGSVMQRANALHDEERMVGSVAVGTAIVILLVSLICLIYFSFPKADGVGTTLRPTRTPVLREPQVFAQEEEDFVRKPRADGSDEEDAVDHDPAAE